MDSLALLTFLPLAGALALLALPAGGEHGPHGRRSDSAARALALAVTGLTAFLGARLFVGFDGSSAALQRTFERDWFTLPWSHAPVRLALGVDGLSVTMAALTAVLTPLVVLSTWGHVDRRVKEFMVWLLVMETGMLGTFLATDLVLFYFFWEASLVPLYFIVGIWGGECRLYATLKFFLYTLAGSLLMLVAVIWLVQAARTSSIPELTEWASRPGALGARGGAWLFLAFAAAFAIKVPLIPFHTWLPDAHTEAPTSGSVILAGVLLKMGTYGLLRFCIGMFPAQALAFAPWFMALGAVGIAYGAFLAMAQNDLKRLIACSSVSHLGYVVLGLFALNQPGLRGGLLQMVNHGLSTGLLFLLVGMLYERRHSRMLDQFGGVALVAPAFAAWWVFAVLSSAGLPGLNGFVGEYLVLLGAWKVAPPWAAVAASGVILGAVYLLSATRRMLFGPVVHAETRHVGDLRPRELALMLPIGALIVWFGVQPGALLDKSAGSIAALEARIARARVAAADPSIEDGAGAELPGAGAAELPAAIGPQEAVAR
jgi:NADH-quinone oxidoreductase subunit M